MTQDKDLRLAEDGSGSLSPLQLGSPDPMTAGGNITMGPSAKGGVGEYSMRAKQASA